MPERLALKRLTASDLTLFESLFRSLKAGNQKAINLNADVFVSNLYPHAPSLAPEQKNEIPLALSVFGPGAKSEHRLARKIIKNPSYKNWRLNGEFISGPDGDPGRYDVLHPGDLAVMSFQGDALPKSLEIVLLGQNVAADASLHTALYPLLGSRSMIPLSPMDISEAIAVSGTPIEHPINQLIVDPALDTALEDAALGGERGRKALQRRRAGRNISRSDLMRARQNADRVGLAGEGLINAYLNAKLADGSIVEAEWSSDQNAISPYDFLIRDETGAMAKLEVKSTGGPFENDIHISLGELIEASRSHERYDLYRVYELDEQGGKLKISENLNAFAETILSQLEDLPSGISCDSFSISVDKTALTWTDELYVARPTGDDPDDAT